MGLQWFRMYAEFCGDPSIQCLSFEDQRHYVMVLCFKASGFLDRPMPNSEFRDRAVCRALGLDLATAIEARERLSAVGLVDSDWQPRGWDSRQFKSDVSTDRVKRFRAKNASSNLKKEEETDTETDTERSVTETVSETFHETLPVDAWNEWKAFRKARRWSCSPIALKKQLHILSRYDTETQRQMLDNSIQAGWRGIFPLKGGQPKANLKDQFKDWINADQ